MAAFCVPKTLADKLKSAAKNGDINVADLFNMSSSERRAKFAEYVDQATAQEINAGFEKSLIKDTIEGQKRALKSWAERTFTGGEKKTPKYKSTIDKIDELNELGVLTPENEKAFLQDLVTTKLGVTVSPEEAKNISDRATKLQQLSEGISRFGDPTDNPEQQMEYFTQRAQLENYMKSLVPSHQLRVATGIIARGTLLASLKSPLLNISSNSILGLQEAVVRRLETRSLGGNNNGLAMHYSDFATEVYKKTGYDLTRMITMDERPIAGETEETRVNTQGKGLIRKVGRAYEDLVLKGTQGLPDVKFASLAFGDRANIEATKAAASEGLKGIEAKTRAAEIMRDAFSITPATPVGDLVRKRAMANALYATATQDTVFSKASLGIRKVFNDLTGDLRVGDLNMPFVKTTANFIGIAIDYSGTLLVPEVLYKGMRVILDMKETGFKDATAQHFSGFAAKLVRAGIGLTGAYLLSSMFKPDEFIGAYPTSPKEQALLNQRNGIENSVLIGGRWVSLDYFNPLDGALIGFLYAKKYGKDLPSAVYNYYLGVINGVSKVPGFQEFYNTVDALNNAVPDGKKTLADVQSQIANFAVDFVASRVIPSLISDIAKGTDTVVRQSAKTPLAAIENKIPGLREQLPAKENVFGDKQKEEGLFSTLFFGSRVKTANDSTLSKELVRLSDTGNTPALNDLSSTQRAKNLEKIVGAKQFPVAMWQFGQIFKQNTTDTIGSPDYQTLDDAQKAAAINKDKEDAWNYVLDAYGYYDYFPKTPSTSQSSGGGGLKIKSNTL